MSTVVRILLLADTHLGFDLPVNPRVHRRRRGHDFLANYSAALQPALAGEVDLVVHGGDVFNRSRPVSSVVWQAFEPLTRVADRGVPVYVVPGNHERGRIPHLRFAQHPGIHVFDRPRTFVAEVRGVRVLEWEGRVRAAANFADTPAVVTLDQPLERGVVAGVGIDLVAEPNSGRASRHRLTTTHVSFTSMHPRSRNRLQSTLALAQRAKEAR